MTRRPIRIAAAAVALLAAPLPMFPATPAPDTPQEKKATGWKDTAELGYVATAGNSETNTLGFKDKLWRQWERSTFELNAGAVRAAATTITLQAIGTAGSFSVDRQERSALTAESYFLNGRYDRKITEHFFWFVGGGWDRNRFAGVENRSIGTVGVGNIWIDTDRVKFRTNYSATYTDEKDVADNPNFKANYSGVRVGANFLHAIGAHSSFTNDVVLDENLDDTTDYRGTMTNSLTVAINARLALKASVQWLYDHEPAFKEVDLLAPPPPGGAKTGTVPVQLEDLDSIFTTSLVINF